MKNKEIIPNKEKSVSEDTYTGKITTDNTNISKKTMFKDRFNSFFSRIKSFKLPISDDASKIIKRMLTLIAALVPACFIEFLALTTECDISITSDRVALIITHLAAIITFLIILFRPKVHAIIKLIPVLISPFASFLMLEFLTHNPFMNEEGTADMAPDVIWLNITLFIIALLTLVFITGRTAPAVITVTVLPLVLGLVSYFTLEFRGTPLFPWDLASYGTAASVISEYNFTLTPNIMMIISCAVLSLAVAVIWNLRVSFPKKFIRPILAMLMCAVTVAAGSYVQSDKVIKDFGLYPYLFTPKHLYKTNGFTVSFLMNLRYATVDKPSGYSNDAASEIAENYVSDSVSEVKKKPNVIVIMNEAFADMSVLADYETTAECLPFISSLEKNTVKGNVHVSVVGGNTPNSEFEFLTGMSMGFLPAGSIPYQQFINAPLPSLATQMNDLGYRTIAMHPYAASGWERDTVYPYMDFEEMYFNDSPAGYFSGCPRLRSYVSDLGLYTKIEQLFNTKEDGEPMFVFAVTMQNHSGYSNIYENFMPLVKVKGLFDVDALSNYMSLIRESDRAFSELVRFFSKSDEETVILMFGDHQPNDSIAYPLMANSGVILDESDLEGSEKRYIVPYVMWSNYEVDSSAFAEEMSLNYLSAALMDTAGLPMTASQKMLADLMGEYPVLNGRCFIDSEGKYHPVSDYGDHDALSRYAIMQYNYLFDVDERVNEFFKVK